MLQLLRFTNKKEQEVRQYLPASDDSKMKKVFEDARLWPGVVSYVEFEAESITAAGIRDALFTPEYFMKKTPTKLGRRRKSGVRGQI